MQYVTLIVLDIVLVSLCDVFFPLLAVAVAVAVVSSHLPHSHALANYLSARFSLARIAAH
jgi:hypothetical protein